MRTQIMASTMTLAQLVAAGAIALVLGMLIALLPAGLSGAQDVPPGAPHCFCGDLTMDGQPAPAGTLVEARVDDQVVGSIVAKVDGVYATCATAYDTLYVWGLDAGAQIRFFADGAPCNGAQTVTYQPRSLMQLDLEYSASQIPSPTPTVTFGPTPTATGAPVVTATPANAVPTPTTNTGGSSGSTGGAGGSAGSGGTITTPATTPTPAVVSTPAPAAFEASDLDVEPETVTSGEIVVITARLKNTGGVTASRAVQLKIDGQVEASQDIEVAPGEAHLVSFTVSREDAGVYAVDVEGLTGSFVVEGVLPQSVFSLGSLIVTPGEAKPGDTVTVSFDVANTGEAQGSYLAVLRINGIEEDSEEIQLAGGETRTVTFTTSRQDPGSYEIEIGDAALGGLSDTFLITDKAASVNWAMVGGIIGGVIIVGPLVSGIILVRRRNAGTIN
jgi:hypothetical protein